MSARLAAVLVRILTYRYLTASQGAALMGVSRQAASASLNGLVRVGLLGSFGGIGMPYGGKSPVFFYYVTKKGYAALQEHADLDDITPISTTLGWSPVMAHRLALTDVLIALERGAAAKGIVIERMLMEYRRVGQQAGGKNSKWRRPPTPWVRSA